VLRLSCAEPLAPDRVLVRESVRAVRSCILVF
jgi:hypothetical protein